MGVDWGQAFQIGGIGFGTVFLVLSILAGAVVLVGLGIRRISRGKDEANSAKKGG
jgi:Na+-transporting methylmalonyl-CoA/oxaloacetate decarboxylase gamma subunit